MKAEKDWSTLSNYQSHDLVKRDYEKKHGRQPNASHTKEICSPLIQAQQYFRAANIADRTVYPLLLYYGVLSLSRGMTLFLSRGLREAALSPSHGISNYKWHEEFSKDAPDIANLQIRLNKAGSLIELITATANRSLLRGNSSAVNFKYSHSYSVEAREIAFGDLLARLPDILDHYTRWKGQGDCWKFETKAAKGDAEATFVVPKTAYVNRKVTDQIFKNTPFQFHEENEKSLIYKGPNSLNAAPRLSDRLTGTPFGIGELYITEKFPEGADLSKIALTFCVSYALGTIARYYPSQWLALIQNQRNDAALPTIFSTLDFIESTFPRMVLDFLEET